MALLSAEGRGPRAQTMTAREERHSRLSATISRRRPTDGRQGAGLHAFGSSPQLATLSQARAIAVVGVAAFVSAIVARASAAGGASSASLPVSITNYSRLPVHSAAIALDGQSVAALLGVAPDSPWRLRGPKGLRVSRGTQDSRAVVRAFVSLSPRSRLKLVAEPCDRWPDSTIVQAAARRQASRDARPDHYADGRHEAIARMTNGVVTVDLDRTGWRLSFGSDKTTLVTGGSLDFWVDDQNRGRITNTDPRQLGLARLVGSAIEGCDSSVRADGTPQITIVRRMGGLAAAMRVTETFELLPGLPVLVCRVRWENRGDKPLWIAYVGSGDGIKGRWAVDALMPRPLIERKKSPLLGDLNGGETRPAWLGQLCRISMESPASGCGVGMCTVLPTPGKVGQGSMIWGCGASGFQCNFIDPVQGQFPFRVEPGGILENGNAFLAAQAGTSVFRDTVELWRTVQQGRPPRLASPVAVFLGSTPVAAQTIAEMSGPVELLQGSGMMRQAAVRMDFNRHFDCRVRVKGASAASPMTLTARPLGKGKRVTLLKADRPGDYTVGLNQATGWKDEVAFVIEAPAAAPAAVEALSVAETLPVAPQPMSPLPGASFTDIATMFRWKAIPLVVDYDLQWSASPDFANPVDVRVSTSDPWPWHLPPADRLPKAGRYWWRVRGVKGDVLGAWSETREFTVNEDRTTRPLARPITAADPLFTIEASKVTDFTDFRPDLPADLAPYLAVVAEGYVHAGLTIDRFARGMDKLPCSVMVRSHHPTWVGLADIEWLCRNVPNFIGIQGGETLSSLYAESRRPGGEGDADYHRRMTMVCAKYGKVYQEADGTYGPDKWQDLMDRQGQFVRKYGRWLVLTQKNNVIRRQFYSQSAAMGLWLGGITHQHGAWEDGGFYWQNAGFGEIGQCFGQRRGVLRTMPRIFWGLVFVMGVSRGCAVYSLDGQTLMFSPKEAQRWPDRLPRAVIWDTTGRTTETFNRFVVPLVRGIVEHRLIPTRQEVLRNVKLAVYNDKAAKGDASRWPFYVEYGPLYAGTYGFRKMGNIDGQLWEFFPNTGRYYFIPVLPQGNEPLAPHVRNLPVSSLQDVARVRKAFDAAYPKWYEGEAPACLVGETLTVLNSRENENVTESFAVPLKRGPFGTISGRIGPHAYLVGKIEDGGRRLWFQANSEYPDRDTELSIACSHKPDWRIAPASATKEARWDEQARRLVLRLSHKDGAVEVTASRAGR